jgi:hypothetical protein
MQVRDHHILHRRRIDPPASQNFIMADGHDGPMPMDFYIWAGARSAIAHGEDFVMRQLSGHRGVPSSACASASAGRCTKRRLRRSEAPAENPVSTTMVRPSPRMTLRRPD